MVAKKLDKESKYAKFDSDGDGIDDGVEDSD